MISKRLKVIADMIGDNVTVLDVGCDHGLLDIYLYLNRENLSVIGSDISECSIESANQNAKKYGVEGKIEFLLSDGLEKFDGTFDYLVISGMGGLLAIDILKRKEIAFENIIIQVNNKHYEVRKALMELGYKITEEKVTKERNKFYITINFKRGKINYSKSDLEYGPLLKNSRDRVYLEKLNKDKIKIDAILKTLSFRKIKERIAFLKKKKNIKKIIKKNK